MLYRFLDTRSRGRKGEATRIQLLDIHRRILIWGHDYDPRYYARTAVISYLAGVKIRISAFNEPGSYSRNEINCESKLAWYLLFL